MSAAPIAIGISLGRLTHWNDGLGEFSRRLGEALAQQAPRLAEERGWRLHFHLPREFHGVFGDAVGYLATHTTQRWLHLQPTRFALWHTLHQHIRLRAPLGTQQRLETVHDLNFLHLKQGAKLERYRRRTRARLAARDAVVAISRHTAADIGRELAPLGTPVTVIPNGATDCSGDARRPVDGVVAGRYLLHLSRLAPSKNIAALLDLAAAWPERPLVLAGGSSVYSDAVRREIDARGLGNVRLALDIDGAQKAWLYANCEAFLFPSFTEGFGLPPLEAMHFGKPVFLSRLTSLPEVGGDAAYYFDRFEPAAMRATIADGLAQHRSPARAEAAIARARSFSWTRCAEGYLALYGALLDGAAPR